MRLLEQGSSTVCLQLKRRGRLGVEGFYLKEEYGHQRGRALVRLQNQLIGQPLDVLDQATDGGLGS